MANIEEKIENLVKPKIEELGYSLYDVQYVKEGQNYILRIFIEKPNGSIDLNDCEKVNNGINDLLDNANYIKEQYFLEVSSTGVEKTLRKEKHLEENIGKEIQMNLFKPIEIDGKRQKEIVGILKSYNSENITIEINNKEKKEVQQIQVLKKDISQIKTVFDWDSID